MVATRGTKHILVHLCSVLVSGSMIGCDSSSKEPESLCEQSIVSAETRCLDVGPVAFVVPTDSFVFPFEVREIEWLAGCVRGDIVQVVANVDSLQRDDGFVSQLEMSLSLAPGQGDDSSERVARLLALSEFDTQVLEALEARTLSGWSDSDGYPRPDNLAIVLQCGARLNDVSFPGYSDAFGFLEAD
jgi:hypothetical protein